MQRIFNRVDTVVTWVENIAMILACVFTLILMIFIVLAVFGRDFLAAEIIPGSIEISKCYLMPVVALFGAAFAYRAGVFPRVDFLVTHLAPPARRWSNKLCLLIEFITLAVLVRYTWQYAVEMTAQDLQLCAGVQLLPLWPVLFVVPVGCGLIALRVALNMWNILLFKPES